jgi:hypothetical protein
MKIKMNDRERQEKGERRILKEVKMNGRKRQEVGTTKLKGATWMKYVGRI